MSIKYAVSPTVVPTSKSEDKAACIACAERVMGAFLHAVQRRLGPEAARRAAGYWIEAFEKAVWTSGQAGSALKKITISAASRLAQETNVARLAEMPL